MAKREQPEPTGREIELDPRLPAMLLTWYTKNARDLPWRRDNAPYHVWISEIMLQQTRAEVVRGYYARFIEAVPTIDALASLDGDALLKLWEGLGYYSRARNLQRTAKLVVDEYGGHFPDTYGALRKLPGVGPYTAGAIASICFDAPTPAVDGNALRITARIAGIHEPMDTPAMHRRVARALAAVYPEKRRGDFTQSLMELGATLCLPNGAPKCEACPVATVCYARQNNATADLPVRRAKKGRRTEQITVLALSCEGTLAIRRRAGSGLLAGLWELPNVQGELDAQGALDLAARFGAKPVCIEKAIRRTHVFTHIQWDMTCYSIECAARPEGFVWADGASLADKYALPSAFSKLL